MSRKGQIFSASALASIFGVHRNTVNLWLKKGCPYVTKADRKQGIEWELDSAEVAQWRLDQSVEDAVGDINKVSEIELRRRKLAAETIVAEIEAARARDEVGDVAEFEGQVEAAAIEIRTRLRQMVSRVSPMVHGAKRVTDIKRILSDEVDHALTAIADELGA